MMYCTEVMVEQHANISRMLKIIQAACCAILEGGEVDQKEFADIIDFIRNYADNHHHRREEEVLFPEMVDNLEEVASIIIKHGMLVEHDLVRAHVRALEEALKLYDEEPKTEHKLQILAEAMAYANRLQMHVEKENNVVYPLADRSLPENIKEKIDICFPLISVSPVALRQSNTIPLMLNIRYGIKLNFFNSAFNIWHIYSPQNPFATYILTTS